MSSDRCRSGIIYIYRFPPISTCVLKETLIMLCFALADDLHINIFVAGHGTVVQPVSINNTFGCKQAQQCIVEHINWVSSELSAGVHKMLNHISRTCISLLQ